MTADTADSDESLISAFKAGDALAMEALFGRYRRNVYGWLVRMLADETEAEDVYQDVWLRVVRNVDSYRNGSFKCWLWRIVHNCTTDRMRRKLPSLTLDVQDCDDDDAGTALMLAIFALQDSFGTACNVTGDGALTLILTGYANRHNISDSSGLDDNAETAD